MFLKYVATLLILFIFPLAVIAEPEPLWEFGVGTAGMHLPHYLGADQQSAYLIPIPYAIYRGDVVRADRGGLRGVIYDSENLDLKLSFSGSLPVNSKDNDAREGMDDLDWMLEVGPTLQYLMLDGGRQSLIAEWPVRAAFTVGDKFLYHQGWTTNPRLRHQFYKGDWTLTTTAGPVFSDHRYHGYIYDVEQAFVTASRPFYNSGSGYTASRLSLSLKRHYRDYFVATSVSYYNLVGAENEGSPLVKQDHYLSFNVAFAWIFKRSARMAGK